jgi:hypothetical protein
MNHISMNGGTSKASITPLDAAIQETHVDPSVIPQIPIASLNCSTTGQHVVVVFLGRLDLIRPMQATNVTTKETHFGLRHDIVHVYS